MLSVPWWARRAAFGAVLLAPLAAPAIAGEGRPRNWQFGLQDAATPIARQMHDFNNMLLMIVIVIVAFVAGLLLWVAYRYNETAHPVPSRTSHNTALEITWTVVPVLILLVIAIPSFRLLYAQYNIPKADMIVKVTGHQWYWTYNYPDNGNFSFDAYMLDDKERKGDQPRLLAVDNEVVVPAGKVVRMLVAADDVIHSWSIPSFGVKVDAVPGRVTQTWFKALEPGVYYGQCSQLCGTNHAFMPIAVRVLGEQEFAAWVSGAKKKFASSIPAATTKTLVLNNTDGPQKAAAAAVAN